MSYSTNVPRTLNGDFSNASLGAIVQGPSIPTNTRIDGLGVGFVHINKNVTGNQAAAQVQVIPQDTSLATGGMIRYISASVLIAGANTNCMLVSIAPGADPTFPSFSWYQTLAANQSNHLDLNFADGVAWTEGTVTITAACMDVGQDLVAPASLGLIVSYE